LSEVASVEPIFQSIIVFVTPPEENADAFAAEALVQVTFTRSSHPLDPEEEDFSEAAAIVPPD